MSRHFLFLVLGIFAFKAIAAIPFPESKGLTSTPVQASPKASEKASTPTATTAASLIDAKNETTNSKTNGGNSTIQVTIYVFNIHSFLGGPYTMDVTGCVPVPKLLYKKTSSIDTNGNCMLLYGRENCQGQEVKIPAGGDSYVSLNKLNFDDILASLQPCKDLKDTSNDTASEHKPVKSTKPTTTAAIIEKPHLVSKGTNDSKDTGSNTKVEDKRHKRSQLSAVETSSMTTAVPPPCGNTRRSVHTQNNMHFQDEEISWNPHVPDMGLAH